MLRDIDLRYTVFSMIKESRIFLDEDIRGKRIWDYEIKSTLRYLRLFGEVIAFLILEEVKEARIAKVLEHLDVLGPAYSKKEKKDHQEICY